MEPSDYLKGVKHVLSWYSKEGDGLVGECALRGLDLEELKVAFRPPEGDPFMFDSYPVSPEAAQFLGKALGIPLHLDQFDYFVECEAADSLQGS